MQPEAPTSAAAGSAGSLRLFVFGALRLVGVPALLIWLLTQVTGATLSSSVLSDVPSLVAGFVVNQIALCVFAARMQLVLGLFGIGIGWAHALRIHLQSMFYFFALPMTVGLEVSRFLKIRQVAPAATVVQTSSALLVDRLLGAGSALATAALCIPFVRAAIAPDLRGWTWLLAGLLALGAASGLLLLWPRARRLLTDAWRLTHGRRRGLVGLLALSMIMHALFAAGVLLVAKGIGLPLGFVDTLFAVAGGMLLVALPVSVAGLGPAEAGTAGLFVAMGYALPVALAASTLPYLLRLVGALEGAAWEFIESGVATATAMRRLAQRQSF
jgi:uncharacterized membrane protein YbhN (UPF0104 family)